jgi:hypothetical protein
MGYIFALSAPVLSIVIRIAAPAACGSAAFVVGGRMGRDDHPGLARQRQC